MQYLKKKKSLIKVEQQLSQNSIEFIIFSTKNFLM